MKLGLGLSLGSRTGQSSGPPLAITYLSDDLGDTLGGHPLVIRITSGMATGVTIGGQPCTSFSQVGTTITCKSPALAAGVYDVQVTSAGDPGPVKVAAFEAWTWTVDVPAIRLFQADAGTTSATVTSRAQVAQKTASMFSIPGDGMGFVRKLDGTLFTLGRWSSTNHAEWPDALGNPSPITNEIRRSTDDGKTLTVIAAHDGNPPTSGPGARFLPGHSTAVFTFVENGIEYIYWIGSDANAGVARDGGVWRSVDGITWERISTTAPTAGKSLYMWGVLDGAIYLMGGQTDLATKASANSNVFRSLDGGRTWTQLADAPWSPRGSIGRLPVFAGKLWVVCGGTYDTSAANRDYYNGVFSFDGTTWTTELADGHGQFAAAMYTSSEAVNGRLYTFNGYNFNTGGNISRIVGTSTGTTWSAYTPSITWLPTHAHSNVASGNRVLITSGDVDAPLWVFEDVTGELVSAWADQGSGALSLVQATAAERPTLVPDAFYGGVPGLAFTGGQALGLAAKDAAIASGVYECDARVRTEDSRTPAQGDVTIDTPNPVIDVSAGSKFNGMGLDVDSFEYHDGAIAWAGGIANTAGVKMNDGVARSFGARHANADLRLYVNGVQNGPTKTTGIGFSTTHTGWQHIGVGFYPANRGIFVLAYAVAAKQGLSASTRAKGAKWARKWRTEP